MVKLAAAPVSENVVIDGSHETNRPTAGPGSEQGDTAACRHCSRADDTDTINQ